LDITANILKISRGGIFKTQIMYRANLSYTQLNEYLQSLLEKNLIIITKIADKEIYETTTKGIEFLHTHHELEKLIDKG
jgi:predicted transcriptional regulator